MGVAVAIGLAIFAVMLGVGLWLGLKRRARIKADEKQMAACEALAEAAYSEMYDARNESHVAACYSDAKEALADAMAIAQRLGRQQDYQRLSARLAHIKAVFRSQFS
jgi:hypothetical protein